MNCGRVAGKVALITGAASGIGKGAARLLAAEGARVVVTDIDADGARRCADDIGDAAISFRHDVTSEQDWLEVLRQTGERCGGLHILVNCAGIGLMGSVEETSLEDWRRLHTIDLDSVFLGCKHALPLLRRSGGGSIVNISSIAGIIASHNSAAYNSAKAAVRHLSKSVALLGARAAGDAKGLGGVVRCNSVHPAFVDTPILDGMIEGASREQIISKLSRQIPLGRVGTVDEVANAILFLASDEASFITGTEIRIDGGISAM